LPRNEVISAIKGESTGRIPVTCVTQVGLVEAMTSTGAAWPEAHTDPAKMAKLGASLWELTGLETARIPFCLTVQAEALGCRVEFGRIDRTPGVAATPFKGVSEVAIPSDYLARGRIPVVLEAAKELKREWGDRLPVVAGIEGIFTLAGHLMGIERLMMMLMKTPAEVSALLEKTREANVLYSRALFGAGADIVCLCEPSASPELISPKMFDEFVKPKLKEYSMSVGGLKVLHVCGKAGSIIDSMADAGFDALSVEEKVDIAEAKKAVRGRARLIGNVSTARTMLRGNPQSVKEEAKKAISAGVDILAPGCGLAPRTPLANVKALVEARNECYQ
jgi:[methyl-Co(III) methanol-specific corrinoid protein]:coenzyme M methyltransferase